MTPEQFAYWLQGFVELNGGKMPTAKQWKSVKEHLAEVFEKVTPPVDPMPGTPRKVLMSKKSKKQEKALEELLEELKKRTERHQRPIPTCRPGLLC